MRASTFAIAFAASAYAAGVDSTEKFDEITSPQGAGAGEGKLSLPLLYIFLDQC